MHPSLAPALEPKSLPRPFLKWAGGKGALLEALLSNIPDAWVYATERQYFEPFFGGGALFFALARTKLAFRGSINDMNDELISTLRALRDYPQPIINSLKRLKFNETDYYKIRDLNPDPYATDASPSAARMIYLNKTCFNGLYRVNRAGKFNVPIGNYKNPTICDEPNLLACSKALREHAIAVTRLDFSTAVNAVPDARGALVYFDPPYVPLNATSDFVSYTKDGFRMADQERLACLFERLVDEGAHVMLSNADVPWVRERYRKFQIVSVSARRNINSKATKRGTVGEVIVLGRKANG